MSLNVDMDAVLLIDAENTFSSINRKVMLHGLKCIWPIIAIYIINCYATPSRLFIVGEGEMDNSTQGDPTAMEAYAWGILPLIKSLLEFINQNEMNSKEVVFVDDCSVAGSLKNFKDYWDKLTTIGPKYGYFLKPKKSYLIVKEKKWWKHKTEDRTAKLKEKYTLVQLSGVHRKEYVKDLVKDWDNQIPIL